VISGKKSDGTGRLLANEQMGNRCKNPGKKLFSWRGKGKKRSPINLLSSFIWIGKMKAIQWRSAAN
jgi:hypothetical protein